ncbi:NACHT, LRR and PYD domains-containing protein 12-like, partial [Python bivittatus]|uniref:NACHT, LRR and PYD domains-containing protein 12-like n=1 Tax=Python bivittatus TaxID=176946 RepID=A0A9F3QTJ9_PYTBI
MNTRSSSSATIENLFHPDKHGLIPQVVVLQGAAGIGKTMTARKIMLDWASEHLYQDMFNYIFYIHCREMNLHADSEKSSIVEIISKQWPNSHATKNTIQEILNDPEKLLFIIDGFDELRFSFDQPEAQLCTDPWKKEPVRILLSSLFKKKLLPESYLLITTRPTALEPLSRCLECSRCAEILGFSVEDRVDFFHRFFQDEEQAKLAFGLVKQNDTLFTLCVIPLVCWIVCTVMKQEMERGKDLQKTPYTLTAVYMLYLSSLLKFHHKESKQDVRINVKGLCSLAAEGLWKQEILFTEEDVKKHCLNQEDSLPLFLNESIFQRDIDCIQTYSFIHLSFQEFFAALFYVLEEGEEQHSENLNENLQTLLEQALHDRIDLTVTVRFLFGFLSEEKRMTRLKQEFGWKISPKNKEFLLDWVKNNIKKRGIRSCLEEGIFHYLYETQDDNFVKNALYDVTAIDYKCHSIMELMILVYCVQHCQNLEDFMIGGSVFALIEEKLFPLQNEEWSLRERYMEDFFKALTELRKLITLRFWGWPLIESFSRQLAEVLRKKQNLRNLELRFDRRDDRAMELVCEGLQHPDCKVEKLRLHGICLTNSYSRHLAEVLRKNQRLRELILYLYTSYEEAVEMVLEGLQHPECKAEKLRLDGEFITASCSRYFVEVLRKNQRLRELKLSSSTTFNTAMEMMFEGMKHPDCKVENLWLEGEFNAESRSRHFAEVPRKNQRLRELILYLSKSDEDAVEMLFEGLKHPDCKVEKLLLNGEFLTASCSRHFAEVLRKNQRLRELKLYHCQSDEKAVEMLFEGLKHPDCTVEKLWLDGTFLTESCSGHFPEVLRKNQRLRELKLSFYKSDEKAVEMLFERLKHLDCKVEKLCSDGKSVEMMFEGLTHPECKVEKLWVDGIFLTESCRRHFLEVLRKNQRLRELKLSFYSSDGNGVEMMFEGLKHPDCKVEKLWVDGTFLTEFCSGHFLEVLRKNQRQRELKLSFYSSDGNGVEMMFEGLKHPDCKVEKLWLDGEFFDESCGRDFAEVLSKNQRLRELILYLNKSDEKAVEMLFEGLKHLDCKVEKLWLDGTFLTESCSGHFAEVLSKNQRLRELKLPLLNTDDRAMEMLCVGLKHPDCKVEKLWLNGDIHAESCSRHFAEVLSKNQGFRELKLSLHKTDDRAVEMLCEGLKHPDCKVEKLCLDRTFLTESCGRHFAEVLRKNQRLRELKLSLCNTDDGTMEMLCGGLKHPDCKVEKLWLDGIFLTESCSRHFAEVLSKNQRLRELLMHLDRSDEKAVEMLCEGLKHPDCKVEKLWIGGAFLKESCGRHIARVLRINQTLCELYLYDESISDIEEKLLCEELKHSGHKLKNLWLNEKWIRWNGEWNDKDHTARASSVDA